jgi:hypothetical protein
VKVRIDCFSVAMMQGQLFYTENRGLIVRDFE